MSDRVLRGLCSKLVKENKKNNVDTFEEGDDAWQYFANNVGRGVRIMRVERGLSQTGMARLVTTRTGKPISKAAVARIESGNGVSWPRLALISAGIHSSLSELFQAVEMLCRRRELPVHEQLQSIVDMAERILGSDTPRKKAENRAKLMVLEAIAQEASRRLKASKAGNAPKDAK